MDFVAVVDQVIALLRQRGRVTYRLLKRQFQLDDEAIEDLKVELITGQRLAVDEAGEVLVWIGVEGTTQASAALPSLYLQQPGTHDTPRTHPATSHPAPPPPDAERRQLTVLFCDLVDSTVLASHLDPENYREVVRAYQATCAEVIQRFAGHIAQYLGDGLLVYFGYPQAHEDDAQRAVRTGLEIVEAMGVLNTRLERDAGMRLAVRIGIHTGPVVVGEMGGGDRKEQLALGETPNIAARLQSLAAPNSVMIGERTRRLVGGTFDVEELGLHELKGVSVPMHVYGIRSESAVESRFEAASARGLTPLIGREEELGLLRQRWHQAQAGEGQVFLLAGEAGIGKSRLIQTFYERMAAEPHIRLRYQCSPYYSNSAFYPIMAQLERAARFVRDEPPAQKLAKLEDLLAQATERVPDVAPLVAALLSIPAGDRYPPLDLNPQRQKERTIEALADQLSGLAHRQPVVLLFEDAHWSDPTSLDVLDRIVHRVQEARVLAVITYRPEFEAPWKAMPHVTALTLTRLSRQQGAAMVERITAGKTLPQEVLTQILAKTDGVPLFVEELTKTVLESGLLRDVGDHYVLTGPLPPLAIPSTLQDSLTAQLDRLAPVKEVAQIGAAIGREFAYELVVAVAPVHNQDLTDALHQLVAAGLLFCYGQPPEARYLFKHALVRDAAYESLLRSTRQQLHTRIATVLEARFPETVEAQPELVAHHYTEAGLSERAVPYWHQAGRRASERAAYVEAIAHLTKGLEVVTALPNTAARTEQELTLNTALSVALMITKGYAAPEVEHVYRRARELCQHISDSTRLVQILLGQRVFYQVRGDLQMARELGEQAVALAQRLEDHALLAHAHYALGHTLFSLAEFGTARAHLEQGIALYHSQQHRSYAFSHGQDPGVWCRCAGAWALWYLGYPDQALARIQEALSLAQELSHPPSLEQALSSAAIVHQLRLEGALARERVHAALLIAEEQGFEFRVAYGTIIWGWALAAQGQLQEGITQMSKGLAAWCATGAGVWLHYWLGLLAEAYGKMGQVEDGLRTLADAVAAVDTTGDRFYEAELYRLKGELLLARSAEQHIEAAGCFHHAIDLARRQQAKSWELRAATSLARLWQQQGKRAEAYELLATIYGWFTEGFDTVDLQEAKALLEKLGR
jgi:predicted ATPase/class 3 adenylate cyclase